MSIKRYIGILILLTGFLTKTQSAFGQEGKVDFDRDKQKRITLIEFNSRVDRATELLREKDLSLISDKDHINIMMLSLIHI